VVESLNLIDIKNKKFKKPKMKFNSLSGNGTITPQSSANENKLNTISSQEGKPKIKFYRFYIIFLTV
jgi:hypothetical protein